MADQPTSNDAGSTGSGSDLPWDETPNDFNDFLAAGNMQDLLDTWNEEEAVATLIRLYPHMDPQVLRGEVRRELDRRGINPVLPNPNSQAPVSVHTERGRIKRRPCGMKYVSAAYNRGRLRSLVLSQLLHEFHVEKEQER